MFCWLSKANKCNKTTISQNLLGRIWQNLAKFLSLYRTSCNHWKPETGGQSGGLNSSFLKKKNWFADWLIIELVFYRKKNRILSFLLLSFFIFFLSTSPTLISCSCSFPHHTPAIWLCFVSRCEVPRSIYIFGIECHTTLQVQEEFISCLPIEICGWILGQLTRYWAT